MKILLYYALIITNYLIGITSIGESILFSFCSWLHYPTGIIVRICGIVIEVLLLYFMIIKRNYFVFKSYGFFKIIIGGIIFSFLIVTDKEVAFHDQLILVSFGLISLTVGIVNLLSTPVKLFKVSE